MILRMIEVKNFCGHEHEQVAFEPNGIVHLSGNSGYGKSTLIIDALAYALFGAKATRANQQNLRNRNFPSEPMRVSVTFEFHDGTFMTVERGLNASGNVEAVVFEPDPENEGTSRIIEETPRKVQLYINRRLGGMNWRQFFSAFVCRQDEIRGLVELTGKDRKDRVHGMLGVHELRKAIDLIDRGLSTIRGNIAAQESKVAGRTSASEAERVRVAQDEAREARERADKALALLQQLRAQLAEAQDTLRPMQQRDAAQTRARELEASVAAKQATLAELDRQLARQEESQRLLARAEEIQTAHEQVAAEVSALREEAARAAQRERLLAQLHTAAETRDEIRARLQSPVPALVHGDENPEGRTAAVVRARIETLTTGIRYAQRERDERQCELERLRDTGECPTCLRGLGDRHSHDLVLDEIERRIAALQETIDEHEAESEQLTEALPELERVERARRADETRLEVVEQQIVALDEQIAEIGDARPADVITPLGVDAAARERTLAAEVAALDAAKQTIDASLSARAETLRAEIADEQRELDEAQRDAGDPVDQEQLAALRERVTELQERVSRGGGRVPEILRVAEAAEQTAAKVEAEVAELQDDIAVLEGFQQHRQRHVDLKAYLEAFQQKLTSDIRPALEEMASEMLAQISNGVHVGLRIVSKSYDIEVETSDGIWIPAPELSGGEQTRLAICIRLALTHLVSSRTGVPVQFLIFDEPLPAQDAGHVEQILELLAALRSRYQQMFIISHVGDLASSEHVDYVLEFQQRRGTGRVQLFKT
jgi:exonuclease SbcC